MNELELILSDICECSRSELYSGACPKVLSDKQLKRLDGVFKQRGRSVPVQYSLGTIDFMGLVLEVNKHVLIPRPETEQLVEKALEIISQHKKNKSLYRIIDIGTGSGCIAIALARYMQRDVSIAAVDISPQALGVARKNARRHSVDMRIQFIQSDLFKAKALRKENVFDLIVSNPPYIARNEIGLFDRTTLREPRIALDGGCDGFDMYRRFSFEALPFLSDDGYCIFEIGDGQARGIEKIFSTQWNIEALVKDYRGIERMCIARPQR